MEQIGLIAEVHRDPSRPAWRGPDPRPVAWTAWYPARRGTGAAEPATAGAPPALFRPVAALRDAEVSDDRQEWPVVLISHGTGGQAEGMAWLGQRLAAAGYICLAVSHHGNTSTEPYLAEGFLCWWERPRDLSFAFECLLADPRFAGRVDRARLYAAGFSLGGYTVLSLAGARTCVARFDRWLSDNPQRGSGPREFPDLGSEIDGLMKTSDAFRSSWKRAGDDYRDPRVRAVVAFAPAPPVRAFSSDSLAGIQLPVGLMVGQDDREAPHEDCAVWLKKQNPSFNLSLLGASVGHYVFLNEATDHGRAVAPEICADADGIDRAAVHDRAAEFALAVFQATPPSEP